MSTFKAVLSFYGALNRVRVAVLLLGKIKHYIMLRFYDNIQALLRGYEIGGYIQGIQSSIVTLYCSIMLSIIDWRTY